MPPERHTGLQSEVLVAVIERLEAAGCRILHGEDAPLPTPQEVASLVGRVAPRIVPASLQKWLAETVARD
jgi:hypothetical protein